MRLLYLDDSGSPNNPQEEYVVLGGVCIPETSARWLSNEIEKLALKLNPTNPETIEFHASEMFRGHSEPWKSMNKPNRIDAIKSVLGVLQNAYQEIVTFACAVHKASFPKEDPVQKAYEDIMSRFNMYLERDCSTGDSRSLGMIIIDKSSYETGLQSLATTIRKKGNQWGKQCRAIIEVPLFIDSKASRITQLADHIAYAVFRRYNADDITYFNCIENRFLTKDGVMHGLAHRQTINRDCTCPACITRKDK